MKHNFLAVMMLSCDAELSGCASTGSKPTGQANDKPATSTENKKVETNRIETNSKGNANVESKINLTASTADKIGIPECDEYIEKYEACIKGKAPKASRAVLKSSFEQMRKSWKQATANPQAKSNLASGCKQAQEMAKKSMSAYACDW